jgi:hypothetical protein
MSKVKMRRILLLIAFLHVIIVRLRFCYSCPRCLGAIIIATIFRPKCLSAIIIACKNSQTMHFFENPYFCIFFIIFFTMPSNFHTIWRTFFLRPERVKKYFFIYSFPRLCFRAANPEPQAVISSW